MFMWGYIGLYRGAGVTVTQLYVLYMSYGSELRVHGSGSWV